MRAVLLLLLLAAQSSVRERMEQAMRLAQAGESAHAKELFEAILDDNPGHGPARLQLGQLALARQDWDEAKAHLEVAVVSSPRRPQLAWLLLGRAHVRLGADDAAVAAFERAVEIAPNFLPPQIALAEIALAKGNLFQSLEAYRQAARRHPGRAEIYAAMANVARRMDALELARCSAEAALSAEPGSGSLHYLLAVIEEQEGDIELALGSVERAIEAGLDNAAVYVTLGNLLHEKMDLSASIAAYEKALELDPVATDSLASFALASLTTSDYARLRVLLELHTAEHPDNLNALYALGAMNLREGRLEKAQVAFEQLHRLLPESSEAQYNLAMTYLRQGRRENGLTAMNRFRELKALEDAAWERGNTRAQQTRRLAELRRDGKHDEAAAIGLELVAEGPMKAEDLLLVIDSLSELSRLEEARSLAKRALDENPYHRGMLERAEALFDPSAAARLSLLDPRCR